MTITNEQRKANKACRMKAINEKKFHCDSCNKSFRDNYTLKNHFKSRIHNPKPKSSYTCGVCNWTTNNKTHMSNHLNTKKHDKKLKSLIPQL